MPLTVNDQLNVLYDLLTEHSEDGCGTVAECQQIARLVHSLQSKLGNVPEQNLQDYLPGIYDYSQQSLSDEQMTEHIYNNQANLKHWVSALAEFKDTRYHD